MSATALNFSNRWLLCCSDFRNGYNNSGACNSELNGRLPIMIYESSCVKPASKEETKVKHKNSERKRRSKICNHFAALRTILPNLKKKNKASVLNETIRGVKKLENTVSELIEASSNHRLEREVPSGEDRLTVEYCKGEGEGSHRLVKVMFCCEDKSTLMSDVARTLRSAKGKLVKAEMVAVGGRVKFAMWVEGIYKNEELWLLRMALDNIVVDRPKPRNVKRPFLKL